MFTYAEKLGLCHYTQEVGDTKMIMLSNTPPGATTRKSRSGSVETKEVSLRKPRRWRCHDALDVCLALPWNRLLLFKRRRFEVLRRQITGRQKVVAKGRMAKGCIKASLLSC